MGEALEAAKLRSDATTLLFKLQAAAQEVGIAELACFLGDGCADLVRI